jgi:hypothetical protein
MGIDDQSRYCVIANAALRAITRPVCQAFLDAMSIYLRRPRRTLAG